jgi:large subunit ribosomal protein L21
MQFFVVSADATLFIEFSIFPQTRFLPRQPRRSARFTTARSVFFLRQICVRQLRDKMAKNHLANPSVDEHGARPFFKTKPVMAYAVFKSGGKQYRVSVSDVIDVDQLEAEPGAVVTFSDVLLVGEGAGVKAGSAAQGATVTAEVIEQRKGPKLIAYKYKRRKGYHRKVGFRSRLTRVSIKSING